MNAVADELIADLGIDPGPHVPAGVMARQIDAKHVLYLNLDGAAKSIAIPGPSRSILYDRNYRDGFQLGAFQPDFIELQ